MSLSTDLEATLTPLATGKAWPMVAAQGTAPPYIVWQRVVSVTENTLQGATDTQNTRVQIDAYASTYAAAHALADSIRAAMVAAPFTNLELSEQDIYEDEVRLFRVTMDYSVWSTG